METIKKESLSKTSREHKQTILDRIGRLREEFPQLNPDKSPEDAKTGNAGGQGGATANDHGVGTDSCIKDVFL